MGGREGTVIALKAGVFIPLLIPVMEKRYGASTSLIKSCDLEPGVLLALNHM